MRVTLLNKLGLVKSPNCFSGGIIELIVYLIIILLPWQARQFIIINQINGAYSEYGTLSIFIFDAIVLAVFIALELVLLISPRKDNFFPRQLFFGFLVISGYLFINTILSINAYWSLIFFWRFLVAFALIRIIIISRVRFRLLVWSLVFAGLWSGILGIYQFAEQEVLANSWLGIAGQSAGILGVAVVEITGLRALRAYGSLSHPNVLGGLIALAILAVIYLYCLEKRRSVKVILVGISSVLAAALFMSFSRSAVIGLMVGLITWLAIIWAKKTETRKQLVGFAVIILLVWIALGSMFYPAVKNRILGRTQLEVNSYQERLGEYSSVFNLNANSGFFGIGGNTYTYKLASQDNFSSPAWAYQPLHNTYLLILVEFGGVGLLISLMVIMILGVRLWRQRTEDFLRAGFLLALIVLFGFIALMDHYLVSSHFGLMILAVLFSLIFKYLYFKSKIAT